MSMHGCWWMAHCALLTILVIVIMVVTMVMAMIVLLLLLFGDGLVVDGIQFSQALGTTKTTGIQNPIQIGYLRIGCRLHGCCGMQLS